MITGALVSNLGIFTGCAWSAAALWSHGRHFNQYVNTIRSFGVLPDAVTKVYALASLAFLGAGGALMLAPATWAGVAGTVLTAGVFGSFSAGALAGWWLNRTRPGLSCGCLGGYLSADLTGVSWVLPACLAVAVGLRLATGTQPLLAGASALESLNALAFAVVLSGFAVVIVELGSLQTRRALRVRSVAARA
jgi:hypothetical protein